ncbi:TPA: hypothetical protein PMC30_003600 [Vibrio cholerae]|nr:hypothetical protein [Vibrio cholerae]
MLIIIFFMYAFNVGEIFEYHESKMPLYKDILFYDQMCMSENLDSIDLVGIYTKDRKRDVLSITNAVVKEPGNLVAIPIYPSLPWWNMAIPKKYVDKSNCKYKSYQQVGLAAPSESFEVYPSVILSPDSSINIKFYEFPGENNKLDKIAILFGTYMRINRGKARLILYKQNGSFLELAVDIDGLVDNEYREFDVPDDVYSHGTLMSVSGGGVSVWESIVRNGHRFSCIKFTFSDEKKGFTPGCPR